MPVFLERFVLAVCAAAFISIAVLNLMKLDLTQRGLIAVILVLIAAFASYTVHNRKEEPRVEQKVEPKEGPKEEQKTMESKPSTLPGSLPPVGPSVPIHVTGPYFKSTAIIRVGAHQDFVRRGGSRIRVAVKGITIEALPSSSFSAGKPTEQVVLAVDTGGGLIYGGNETTYVSVNEYRVPAKFSNNDEPRALYFFHPSENSFRFFCLIIDHINSPAAEVTVDAYFSEYFKD
jgi:hypothetical protein